MRSQTSRRRHAVGESAVRFITRVFSAFVVAPKCASCRTREIQANWVIDAFGCVHGLCGSCGGPLGGVLVSGGAPVPRAAADEAAWGWVRAHPFPAPAAHYCPAPRAATPGGRD